MRLNQFNLNFRARTLDAHTSLCSLYDGLIVLQHLYLTFCFLDPDSEARHQLKNVSVASKASVSVLTGIRKFPKSVFNSLKLSFFLSLWLT